RAWPVLRAGHSLAAQDHSRGGGPPPRPGGGERPPPLRALPPPPPPPPARRVELPKVRTAPPTLSVASIILMPETRSNGHRRVAVILVLNQVHYTCAM